MLEGQQDHQSNAVNADAFLSALMDALPVPTVWTTFEGKIEYINRMFTDTFGYTLQDIPTLESWAERAYPDPMYRQRLVKAWTDDISEARRTGTRMTPREAIISCKHGEVVHTLVEAVPVQGRLLVTLTNITAYRRAEENIKKHQVFTDAVIKSIPGPFFVLDSRGCFVQWNKFDVLRDLPDDRIRGNDVLTYIHEDDRTRVKNSLALVLREGAAQIEARVVSPDRSKTKEYLFSAERLDSIEGSFIVGSGIDLSQRRNAESALRASREYADNLINTANAMVVGLDVNGKIMFFNKAAEDITGYTAAELKGRSWFEVMVPRERYPEVWENFAKLSRNGIMKKFENPILTKSGEERFIVWNNNEVYENGSLTGTVSFGIDITERRMLEEQLRQSQKMEAIGLLAGGIAHDFNNLLNIIIGYSDMVLRALREGSQEHQDVTDIKKASRQAAQLIAQLLAFSRKQRLEPSVVELNTLINDMRQMLQRLIGEDIKLDIVLDPALSPVFIDQNQKEQIIMNLVANARDAMPDGGTLSVSTSNITLSGDEAARMLNAKPGNYVCLRVSDTGMGMDAATRERIFDPFFSTKKVGHGTGLGLSIIFGIVRQHGGWITVESEPGKGATFKVFLPQYESGSSDRAADDAACGEPPRGSGQRVLIAEDDVDIRRVSQRVLTEHGYAVAAVATGKEARELMSSAPDGFHLLFCDSVLPDCSGIALAEDLLAMKPSMRILITSGYFDEKAHGEKVRKNRYHFIHKPYDMYQLLVAVCETLGDADAQGGQ